MAGVTHREPSEMLLSQREDQTEQKSRNSADSSDEK